MEYAIETRGLTKTYKGGIRALRGIDLRVSPGSCFGLLGPNGAGKSTLVKTLLSIVRATSGTAELLGRDHRDPASRKAVGYLPEGHRFPTYLTGRGVCHYFGQLAGLSGASLARETEAKLALVAMSDWADTRVSKYSKGMLQRLGLAQAMLGDPPILFLDEPTDGVDPVGRYELRNVIRGIQATGKTIFLNSHLLSEVEEMCNEIAIMHRGTIMQQGSVAAITTSVSGRGRGCLVTFTTAPLSPALLSRLPANLTQLDGQRGFQLQLEAESAISPLIDLLRSEGVEIYGIQQARLDLEEAFIELIKSPGSEGNTP